MQYTFISKGVFPPKSSGERIMSKKLILNIASGCILSALSIHASASTIQITGSMTANTFGNGVPVATATFSSALLDDSIFGDGNFHDVGLLSASVRIDGTTPFYEVWDAADSLLRVRYHIGGGVDVVELYGSNNGTNCCGGGDDFRIAWIQPSTGLFAADSEQFQYALPGANGSGVAGHVAGVASVSAVPVPAAAWLFGSGLLSLVVMARRKKAA